MTVPRTSQAAAAGKVRVNGKMEVRETAFELWG